MGGLCLAKPPDSPFFVACAFLAFFSHIQSLKGVSGDVIILEVRF